ncbi:MAG: hypothetical protein NXI10_16655 [bacterium]|nr:hypothetical protein [bacterium]
MVQFQSIPVRAAAIIFLLIISACASNVEQKTTEKSVTFGEVIDLENLEKVQLSNSSGTFYLSDKQVEKLKNELAKMKYNPNISAKVGAIQIELFIEGKAYVLSSATNGKYVEIHKSAVTKNKELIEAKDWLYFETGDLNFDNYKK